MSDLPTPITRKEQYLNSIAQGNTSDLPTPITREEEYLDAIAKNGGGGGGGTTNYNALNNKPQIAGTTLQGNKSLADLGIASASDVATALAGKVDKVEGKGLSTNDYDNTEKAEVAKVAGKAEKTTTASGEALALAPTSEGKALIHTVYGMSVQNGTPTPSSPVDIESAKADFRSVGKNLNIFPYKNGGAGATWSSDGITYTVNADGTLDVNGTATADAYFRCGISTDDSNPIFLENGMSYILSGSGSSDIDIRLRNSNNIGVANAGATDTLYECTTSGKYYILVMVKKNKTVNHYTVKPMLRLASVVDNTYEPYKKTDLTTDLTLRAIEVSSTDNYNLEKDGKYYIADTLDYTEDNGFVVTRRIGHDVIDGSTLPVVYSGVDRQTNVFYISETRVMPKKDTNPVISDRFQKVSGFPPLGGNGYIRNTGSNSLRIYIYTTDYTTADDFNAFFTQNNTNVDFILAEPTTENITTEQALALLSLKTYDESTSISSQAEPSCTVAIEYAKERLAAVALIAHNLAKGNDLRIAELEETP